MTARSAEKGNKKNSKTTAHCGEGPNWLLKYSCFLNNATAFTPRLAEHNVTFIALLVVLLKINLFIFIFHKQHKFYKSLTNHKN